MPDALDEDECVSCGGSGYSPEARHLTDQWYGHASFDPASTGSAPFTIDTPEVRAFAERNITGGSGFYGSGETAIRREALRLVTLWNAMWCHHLEQADVDALVEAGRLHDFTHTFVRGEGWKPHDPTPVVTAEMVNRWSLGGLGHDGINQGIVVAAKCKRLGVSERCSICDGHGSLERYPGQRAEAEAWERTDPPAGDGWQLWETVSEGSPISPVFATAEELSRWLQTDYRSGLEKKPLTKEQADNFVRVGWAPSLISDSTGVHPGIEVA